MSGEPTRDLIVEESVKSDEVETIHSAVEDDDAPTGADTSNSHEPPPVVPRGESPIPHTSRVGGGRSTPIHKSRRYQYQPSLTASSSSYVDTDREGYLPLHTYIAVNPFSASIAQSLVNITLNTTNVDPVASLKHFKRPSTPAPPPPYLLPSPSPSKYILAFLLDVLPRQIYLHILLTLPSLYFSRVARVFEEAELSMPDIKKMAIVTAKSTTSNRWKESNRSTSLIHGANWSFEPSIVSPQYAHLRSEWEHFIDSLIKEWKTLNIVSVLLLSAILTTLQIDGAYNDPVSRNAALLALVCAIMSLLYGCLYILRFNTMRKAHKAAEWAEEAQKTRTSILWNVWVLLAMPSVWLSWSIIFYLACILSFVWRTGASNDVQIQLSPAAALGPRIAITAVFAVGVLYFVLIVSTFRRYGAAMDRSWRKRVMEWAEMTATTTTTTNTGPELEGSSSENLIHGGRQRSSVVITEDTASSIRHSLHPPPTHRSRPRSRSSWLPSSSHWPLPHRHPASKKPQHNPVVGRPNVTIRRRSPNDDEEGVPHFGPIKVMDLRFLAHIPYERPSILTTRNIQRQDWDQLIADASSAWDGQFPRHYQDKSSSSRHVGRAPPQDVTASYIAWWNAQFFHPRGVQAVLCQEYYHEHPYSPSHALYLLDILPPFERDEEEMPLPLDSSVGIAERFGGVPEGLERIGVYNPLPLPLLDGESDATTSVAAAAAHRRKTTRMGKTMIVAENAGAGAGAAGTTRVHWGEDEKSQSPLILPNGLKRVSSAPDRFRWGGDGGGAGGSRGGGDHKNENEDGNENTVEVEVEVEEGLGEELDRVESDDVPRQKMSRRSAFV